MKEEKGDRRIVRGIRLLFAIFSMVTLAAGIVAYNLAAGELKKQLASKCHALAATVAALIAEDSDGYAAFLKDMDTDTDYYRHTKALIMKLKQVNIEHVTYVYTEARVDDDTMMYLLGGEEPSSQVYTAPGVKDAMTEAERIAYREQRAVFGSGFVDTQYGVRLSAYEPIIHKDTGEFLGLVGADVIRSQYNSIMVIFIVQTSVSIIAALTVFALCMRWLSGSVYQTMTLEKSKLENSANIDALTGIYNRRYFEGAAAKMAEVAAKSDVMAFVIIFDIDHFKKINDTYGHPAGDKVLKMVAEIVKHSFRSNDLFARYGGDEFILFLFNLSKTTVCELIERIRKKINETLIEFDGVQVQISASFGIAPVCPENDLNSTISYADQALYTAKREGRNRAVFYSD